MRKRFLIIVLALLGMTQVMAQDYEYVPFVREGVKWVYGFLNGDDLYPANPNLEPGRVCLTLELKGDTVIGGKTYVAMHKYYGNAIDESSDTVVILLREEDKVVYGIVPDGVIYPDCPIGIFSNGEIKSKITHGEEFVLYDFADPIGFCEADYFYYQEYINDGLEPYMFSDIITVNGSQRKRHAFNCMGEYCLIEGIGYDGLTEGFTLSYKNGRLMSSPMFFLLDVIEDGEVVYRSASLSENEVCVPIAREGVKWINERVTVNDGVETSYYYTYEFKAEPGGSQYYSCYYAPFSEPVSYPDSVISMCRNDGGNLFTVGNKAIEPIIASGQNLIDFERDNPSSLCIYAFNKADISSYNPVNYYIHHQVGDFLSRENFVEVEPLLIDEAQCRRYAYIGEQGDTLAYVVEGIGFDSRDMGDLLTPFTRKPDPNAEYQEWCGLSHVVKDGKIIYKGMRYRDDIHVGIDEVATDKPRSELDGNYYNLMGQSVGKEVPTTPGIYIHQGKKIIVR